MHLNSRRDNAPVSKNHQILGKKTCSMAYRKKHEANSPKTNILGQMKISMSNTQFDQRGAKSHDSKFPSFTVEQVRVNGNGPDQM